MSSSNELTTRIVNEVNKLCENEDNFMSEDMADYSFDKEKTKNTLIKFAIFILEIDRDKTLRIINGG